MFSISRSKQSVIRIIRTSAVLRPSGLIEFVSAARTMSNWDVRSRDH